MDDYKKVYDEFWKDIVEDENGNINKEQLMKELADFRFLINEASKIYSELIGLSKLTYDAETILRLVNDDYIRKDFALDDLLEMAEDGQVSVEDLKEYLR